MEISWVVLDSDGHALDAQVIDMNPTATLADVVTAASTSDQSPLDYKLFSGRQNDGSWLKWYHVVAGKKHNLARVAPRFTNDASALHPAQSISIFQSAPSAEDVIHLIILPTRTTSVPALEKKNNRTSLHELADQITPSSFANANGSGSWVVKLRDQVECHRFGESNDDLPPLPLVLQHQVFARFQDNCQHKTIEAHDAKFVVELCRAVAKMYDTGAPFETEIRDLLERYLSVEMTPTTRSNDAWSIQQNGVLLLHVVCQRERGGDDGGGGGSDPAMRNVAYFLKHLPDRIVRQMPCFLLDLSGPNMALFGICNTSDSVAVCEPLMPSFPLMFINNDWLMTSLARAWASLKEAIVELRQWTVETHVFTPFVHLLEFPYKRSFTQNGVKIQLHYIRRIKRHVFIAWSSDSSKIVIVKFAKRYGTKVHEYCHAQQFAPELYHQEQLAGGWIFVVMEPVADLVQIWSARHLQEPKAQLAALAHGLREHGFVHGDFYANIMWSRQRQRVVVLDFDWAGREGEVAYPPFMNPDIKWPRGAETGMPILAAHDQHFLNGLL